MQRQKNAASGFTLIEVLVAMCIFAIAVLGLAIGATSVMRANQTGLYTTIATNLAQDRLEELKSRTTANINTTGSPENNLSVSGVPVTFNRSWTVTSNCNSVTGLTCIAVTVTWTDYISHTLTISSAVKQ
ncbi:MAG: prepilin-type N-terminal cleavage/methylation domain-containing protein [Deltaproteobacteria bacterium]|nr:prepilin-type N-terminal cleavage/methylation domain-containing protein [Deltaproteobacteria bacterium]